MQAIARGFVVVAAAVALVVLGSCGSGNRADRVACPGAAKAAVARATGGREGAVQSAVLHPPDGTLACRLRVTVGGSAVQVVADLDSAPQPFQRLERASIETGQTVLWAHEDSSLYPVAVPGVGLEATWFPTSGALMATDGVRIITVTVSWHGAPSARRSAFAAAVARMYLGAIRQPRFSGNS